MKRLRTKKEQLKEKIVFSLVWIIFSIYALGILYVLFFAFNASLKDGGRAFIANNASLSIPPKFSNYVQAFTSLSIGDHNFFSMMFNSIWYSFGNTVLNIMASTVAAYVVCKYRFPGRNFLYSLVLIILMIPIYGALPAKYRLFHTLGFLDSPTIILSATNGFDFAFLIVFSFFQGISWEYAEAAFIDGASHFKVFVQIIPP